MPTKKKPGAKKKPAGTVREEHLGIRLTKGERTRLASVAGLFPELAESTVARIALLRGLELVEREGITLPPA